MKILLDENIPHDLRSLLAPLHEVFTVAYLGWQAIANGELLRAAAASGFDAVVTTDSKIEYEQNTQSLPVAVVVLRAKSNAMIHLGPLIPELIRVLSSLQPHTLINVGL